MTLKRVVESKNIRSMASKVGKKWLSRDRKKQKYIIKFVN